MPACPRCKSTDLTHDSARGDTVCTNCGMVVEENSIVAEIEFVGNANGTSAVVGQHMNVAGPRTYATTTGIAGLQRDSREKTIANGNQKISQFANMLGINHTVIETAQSWFRLALQHNFLQGRQTDHVVAACLYIACRRAKTPHMLIDFSEILQANLYTLGNAFLKLCRVLHIHLPIIDPSLYIHRFAHKLELPYKVGTTALQLVKRMKRDWIADGRRPAGICGACLLIAARLHGYRRTQKEVIVAVSICDATLRKRLVEFQDTSASNLTADEFTSGDHERLEEEADPPSFTKARLLEKASTPATPATPQDSDALIREIMGDEESNATPLEGPLGTSLDDVQQEVQEALLSKEMQELDRVAGRPVQSQSQPPVTIPARTTTPALTSGLPVLPPTTSSTTITTSSNSTTTDTAAAQPPPEEDAHLSEVSDDEIRRCVTMSEREVRLKEGMWMELNRDWVLAQEEKKKQEELSGKTPRVKRKRNTPGKPAGSAMEAVAEMAQRRLSKKINYAVMESLFSTSASQPGTPLPASQAAAHHTTRDDDNADDEDEGSENEEMDVRKQLGYSRHSDDEDEYD